MLFSKKVNESCDHNYSDNLKSLGINKERIFNQIGKQSFDNESLLQCNVQDCVNLAGTHVSELN